MRKKKPPKTSKKAIISKLDIAWSKAVKEKTPYCIICGRTSYLNAHHIFSRRYMSTRWDLVNGVTLCRGCHLFYAHQKYEEFRDKIIEIIGTEEFLRLKTASNEIKKWDLDELQQLLENL